MLYIHAVGEAAPATKVTAELFSKFGATNSPWPEFQSRASVLPSDYIALDGNVTPARSKAIANETPTHLAQRAVIQALEAIQLQAESISLIIGDTVTPWETTPSEGQRVAGSFNLKIPAFDITSAGCFLSTLSFNLNSFKNSSLPTTALVLSANAPTQAVNFRADNARFICGDGAAAAVISSQAAHGFEISAASIKCDPTFSKFLVVDHFGHIVVDSKYIIEFAAVQTESILRTECINRINDKSSIALILPSILGDRAAAIAETLGFSPRQIFSNFKDRGYLFGASGLSVLSNFWEELKDFRNVFLVECGAGASCGWTLLKRVE